MDVTVVRGGLKDFFSVIFKALPVSFFEVDESSFGGRGLFDGFRQFDV